MNNEGTRVHRVVEMHLLITAMNRAVRACVIACLTLLFTGLFAVAQETAPNSDAAGAVSQTKTLDFVSKFTTTGGKLGNSQIFDNGTDVGVGTTTPGSRLDVYGNINAAGGYNLGGAAFAFGSATLDNAFFGFAGNSTTTGSGNTGVGWEALLVNGAASYNTAVGGLALTANTTGHSNAATGFLALTANTTGVYNAGFGNRSLQQNTTGGFNAAIGAYSGNTIDGNPLTGSNDTGLGAGASFGNDSITNATAVGSNALVSESNALVLGCIAGANNCGGAVKVGIGTATPANVFTIVQGGGEAIADSWDTYSSRRWKTNIQTLHGALAKVEQLRGVSYDLKANGKHELGVIAEEVAAVVPELVSFEDNGKDARGVDYSRLTALLIEATKEQQKEFRQQRAELTKALQQIKEQQRLLRAQNAAMWSLEAQVIDARETMRQLKAQVPAGQPGLAVAKSVGTPSHTLN